MIKKNNYALLTLAFLALSAAVSAVAMEKKEVQPSLLQRAWSKRRSFLGGVQAVAGTGFIAASSACFSLAYCTLVQSAAMGNCYYSLYGRTASSFDFYSQLKKLDRGIETLNSDCVIVTGIAVTCGIIGSYLFHRATENTRKVEKESAEKPIISDIK